MTTVRAAIGSAVFFLLAPGIVAGVLPWLIGRASAHELPLSVRGLGVAVALAGLVVLVKCFADFVAAKGTPAPVAPTERVVVEGLYRYVRNPMYVAVITIILGQSLWHGSWWVLGYAALAWAIPATFVRFYEEPSLRKQFGADYEAYRAAVPAWIPRLKPWHGKAT